jgi:hypothetical protein
MRRGFCEDLLRCFWTKVGSETSVFHDLLTHLNRMMDLTLKNDKISTMSSLGMNTNGGINGSTTLTSFLLFFFTNSKYFIIFFNILYKTTLLVFT